MNVETWYANSAVAVAIWVARDVTALKHKITTERLLYHSDWGGLKPNRKKKENER